PAGELVGESGHLDRSDLVFGEALEFGDGEGICDGGHARDSTDSRFHGGEVHRAEPAPGCAACGDLIRVRIFFRNEMVEDLRATLCERAHQVLAGLNAVRPADDAGRLAGLNVFTVAGDVDRDRDPSFGGESLPRFAEVAVLFEVFEPDGE